VNLIAQPSATVVPYIHDLVIDQVKIRHLDLFEAMFLRLRPFEFLRRLELWNIRWCNYEPLSVDTLVSASSNVTDVRLRNLIFDKPTDLWSVVARFPSLEQLSVTNPAFFSRLSHLGPRVDVTNILPHLRPPNIHVLELSETLGHRTHILDWFCSRGTLVNSISVALGSLDFSSLNQYLQVLGPSLLFLQMDVPSIAAGACSSLFSFHQVLLTQLPIADVTLLQLNLSFSTHLQKLRFRDFGFGSRHTLSSTMPATFARAVSSHIYDIEFAYGPPERPHFSLELENDAMSTTPASSMWSALDAVLSTFSSLCTVRFRLSSDQSDPLSFVSYVKRGLRSCNARGILSFEDVLDGMSESDPELGACHSLPFYTEQDSLPPYLRPASRNGVVSGPLCIAQLQERMV
jgi:hypothetical protein